MRPFTDHTGRAVPVMRRDIDTDVLIRIERLIENPPDALGPFLFEAWRYLPDGAPDPGFPLNQERYAGASVLIAGANFGCGSSREHAVWALDAQGIRCVIAPSFGDIFVQNCFQNGVLPVPLAEATINEILAEVEQTADTLLTVDLRDCTVRAGSGGEWSFSVADDRREALLQGLDEIGSTLLHEAEIDRFSREDSIRRPWVHRTSEEMRVARVLILAGDGIGGEILPEVRRVVEWFGARRGLVLDLREELFGIPAWRAHGTLMRPETWQEILAADAILFGAIGAPEYAALPEAERLVDWLLEMRRTLDLFENLRPIRSYEPLLESSTLRPEVIGGVDMVIVRELCGGVYFNEPRGIETLPNGTQRAVNTYAYTTAEIERIARAAFVLARTRRGKVCSVDKANVLENGRLWRDVVCRLHESEFPDIDLSHLYVDNCAMQLVRNPRQFDVMVTENLFGDILSDCAAMSTGSLGMLPSASLGPVRPDGTRPALYEPIHGSAPDIAGLGIANPLGAIASFAMCLRHSLGRPQDADLLERAIEHTLLTGARTADIARPGEPTLNTEAMGDAVIAALETLTEG
jgi:3-isopropylmalate dehydrogenase